jgi:hypothetical protein
VFPIPGGRLLRHSIQKLVPRYDKCLSSGGEYVKKKLNTCCICCNKYFLAIVFCFCTRPQGNFLCGYCPWYKEDILDATSYDPGLVLLSVQKLQERHATVNNSTSISCESGYKISHSFVDVLIFYVLLFGVVMRFLTADQKQQHVYVCKELRQSASDDATFLSRVITGDES